MSKIVIIGAGMMGSAMAMPCRDNGHEVHIVGTPLDSAIIHGLRANGEHLTLKRKLPSGCSYFLWEEADKALAGGADVIIGGVSSFGVDWFMQNVLPALPPNTPVLSITKGLMHGEGGRLVTFPDAYAKTGFDKSLLCAVGGPCTSYELADRRQTEVCFCGDDLGRLKALQDIVKTDYYHVGISTDVTGIEGAVALKNAYALAVSMAVGMLESEEGEGCPLAYNPQAGIFTQCAREINRILSLMGARPDSLYYSIGDLYVTIYGGRTRRLGILLGRGLSLDEALAKLEGVTLESVAIARVTVEALCEKVKLHQARQEEFPLLFHIGRLLDNQTGIPFPWDALAYEAN